LEKKRCKWVNLKSPVYVRYHDDEWGVPSYDDHYLFEMLLLESFQAGLSWSTILNKRENFRAAFDNFDVVKISRYDEAKQEELRENTGIVRNRLKINAAVNNAKIFIEIQREFGSFSAYIWGFTAGKIIKNKTGEFRATSPLSDKISVDLKKRGMKFVGSTIIYSYLQAIGIVDDHEPECFMFKRHYSNKENHIQ